MENCVPYWVWPHHPGAKVDLAQGFFGYEKPGFYFLICVKPSNLSWVNLSTSLKHKTRSA